MLQYAIAKKDRYRDFEVTGIHPFHNLSPNDSNQYNAIRARTYLNLSEAWEAATIASRINPVGFTVVILEHAENSSN